MKSIPNLKYAKITKNYYGHNGAIYAGDKVIVKEIKSEKIKIETMTGKIYFVSPDIIKIT